MQHLIETMARDAGRLALEHQQAGRSIAFESKGHLDLVTVADRAVEALVLARLSEAFPDDGVFGEEGGQRPSRSGRVWVIDPIDGTFNFVRGSDQWSVSIGLYDGQRPIFGAIFMPAQDRYFAGGLDVPPTLNGERLPPIAPIDPRFGAAGVGFSSTVSAMRRSALINHIVDVAGMTFRHSGCGTTSLLDIALGRVDGYVGLGESSWDIMAALAILEPLGAKTNVDWANTTLSDKLVLACGRPEFVDQMAPVAAFGETVKAA
jgi:myo-inositol-1(or 4)-monophosphatase